MGQLVAGLLGGLLGGLHDISTEVFGRAYLEVRAGYFTH
jgi:hypothetical protein